MEEQITKVLKDKVDPVLAAHYGGAVLTKFENKIAYVRLTGSCASCPSAQGHHRRSGEEASSWKTWTASRTLILDTSVSDDLLDMARRDTQKGSIRRDALISGIKFALYFSRTSW